MEVTPRDDARKLRSNETSAVNAECILEIYELLWRWGNLDRKNRAFKPRCDRAGQWDVSVGAPPVPRLGLPLAQVPRLEIMRLVT